MCTTLLTRTRCPQSLAANIADEISRNRHKMNQIPNVQFDKLQPVPIASHTVIPKGSKRTTLYDGEDEALAP